MPGTSWSTSTAGLLYAVARSFRLDAADAERRGADDLAAAARAPRPDRGPDPAGRLAGDHRPPGGDAGAARGPAGSGPSSRTPCSTGADDAAAGGLRLLLDERNSALWEAFARLTEKCRQLLRVAVTQPQAYDEISEALGMPIGSIGPTRRRCLTQLRALLDGHRGDGGGGRAMSAPWEDDEALLLQLGTVLDELDPMPPEVVTEGPGAVRTAPPGRGAGRAGPGLAPRSAAACWRCAARATCG